MNAPVIGYYKSGQYVTVPSQQSRDDLKLLGNFGFHPESAQRKKPEKRGPWDRLLVDSKVEGALVLLLSEAYYLAYALGCLKIVVEGSNQNNLSQCWTIFRDFYKQSCGRLDFALEYGVYHFFRSRDWIIKTGHNFGTHFLLYREGPSIDHAQFAIYIIDNKSPPEWQDLLTVHRVMQSACKKLLLAYVQATTAMDSPVCASKMHISIRPFEVKTNLLISNEPQPALDLF